MISPNPGARPPTLTTQTHMMTRQSNHSRRRLGELLGRICRGLTILSVILISGAAAAGTIYFVGTTIIKILAR